MNEEGVNQTYAYDGYTAGPTYDAGPMVPPMIDEMGLPVADQDPPKPLNPPGLDSDEPKIIDRK